jgi:hypothetical protein
MANAGGRHDVHHEDRSEINATSGGCCCFGARSKRSEVDAAEVNADALESQIGAINLDSRAHGDKHVRTMNRGDLIGGAKGMQTGHACVLHSDVREGNGDRKTIAFSDEYTPQMQSMPLNDRQFKQIIGALNAGIVRLHFGRRCRKKCVGFLVLVFSVLLLFAVIIELNEEFSGDAIVASLTTFTVSGYFLYGACVTIMATMCLCARMIFIPSKLHAKDMLRTTMKPFRHQLLEKKLDMALHAKTQEELTLYIWTQGANIDIKTDGLTSEQFGFLEF